jgi:hypothetical protein
MKEILAAQSSQGHNELPPVMSRREQIARFKGGILVLLEETGGVLIISHKDLLPKLTNRQREVLTLLVNRLPKGEVTRLLALAEARELDITRVFNLLHRSQAATNKHRLPANADSAAMMRMSEE